MVVLNRIYTRTGDKGETALSDGSRRPKHDLRVEAYGCVDEANSALGLARLHAEGEMDAALGRIQNELFDLGADLSRPNMEKDSEEKYAPLRMISLPDRASGAGDRRHEQGSGAFAQLRSAGRIGFGGLSAPRPDHGPPRRAPRHGARRARRREPRRDHLSQPAFGLALRGLPRGESNGAGDVLWVPGGTR